MTTRKRNENKSTGALRSIGPVVLLWMFVFSVVPARDASAVVREEVHVTIREQRTIYTVTLADNPDPNFKAHVNFPYMKRRADGALIVTYSAGQTQSGLTEGRQSISTDGGLTWVRQPVDSGDAAQQQLIRPAGQASRGFGVRFANPAGFTSWNNNGRFNSFDGGVTWSDGTDIVTYRTGGVQYTRMEGNFGDVLDLGGTLLMPLFGERLGVTTAETVLYESQDDGKNWDRRSTVAAFVPGPESRMGSEGAVEASIVQLDNGNLLSVYRTGQTFPNTNIDAVDPSLFFSTSSDEGFTWTEPKMLGVAGVFPLLRKLDDGTVALTYGRYGAKVMFANEEGSRWSFPFVIHDGPSSGHTEMRPAGDGSWVFVYDESGFYPPPWNNSVPDGFVFDNDESANLRAAILEFDRQTIREDFGWRSTYQGDVTPDTLADPWEHTSDGDTELRLWADLGQDYMRIDPGTGSQLYYTLSGSESSWNEMDFLTGVVVEMRARVVGPNTGEGGARLVFGDGVHGKAIVELTGHEVVLQGEGGNAGQIEFPEIDTLDWHVYRVIVEPQEPGGDLAATLFIDEMDVPLATLGLEASTLDALRFGDTFATTQGIFDVDYLRFATVPEPSGMTLLGACAAWLAVRRRRR